MTTYKRSYFGNEITARKVKRGKAIGGHATVSRGGRTVHEIEADDLDAAFEEAWRWACMNRDIRLRTDGDLVERKLLYTPPDSFVESIIYRSASKAEIDEAELAFREVILPAQWARELEEHERRREALPAKLAVLAQQAAEVEAQITPLKDTLKGIKAEAASAPAAVFKIETDEGANCEDRTQVELEELMIRRLAERSPSIADLAAEPEAEDPRVACPACGAWVETDKAGKLKPHRPPKSRTPLLEKTAAGWCSAAGMKPEQVLEETDGEVVDPVKKTPRRRK